MLMGMHEIDNIETVGDLRRALADVPDDMDICDIFGEGLLLCLCRDEPNTKFYIEVK